MSYKSINPVNGKIFKEYKTISNSELNEKLELGNKQFKKWSALELKDRILYVKKIAKHLKNDLEVHAKNITLEMGKPITQARAEIEKSILLCNYYCENAEQLLSKEVYKSNAKESYVVYEPMGIIYAVMPWNFPYWQVFRFLIPNLILGNAAVLKHASNVPGSAQKIEEVVLKAGVPKGVFQNLFINYKQSEKVIESDYVWGVTLTGSEYAGSMVAQAAGKNIKKSILELGGNDSFILLHDADVDTAVEVGVSSRMNNSGQSCIAAKRFIVHKNIFDEFVKKYLSKIEKLSIGNPMESSTDIGPIATKTLIAELEEQVNKSVKQGAKIVVGGERLEKASNFYKATLITDIKEGMPLFSEETFGPVTPVFKVENDEEAILLANNTELGLGASLWTKDIEKAKMLARKIMVGTVAINGMVKSDPRLPFGGTKKSGFGRELSDVGLKEFSNMKTINIF